MYYLVDIYEEKDLDKLRNFDIRKNKSNRIIINIKNDIHFNESIRPINLEGFDVIINGFNNTISNIKVNYYGIDRTNKDFSAIFSKVRNLYIYDLNIKYSYIFGGIKCGTVAGEIYDTLTLNNINATNLIVNADAYCGGIAGRSKVVNVFNSNIQSCVYAHDVVGGVVGMTNKYIQENSIIDTEGVSIGKAIGVQAGDCDFKLIKKN